MCKFLNFQTWFVLSLIWTAAVFYFAYMSWPQMSLDLSPLDPATVSAMQGALLKHSLCYGALAAGPPLVALLAGRRMCAGRA
jgi:hypothetical protein